MSTWISRAGLASAACLALAACLPAGLGGGGTATRAISVSNGGVTVAGPTGYCIDKSALRDGASGAFVLLGTCAAISGSRDEGQPDRPAVLTASVLPEAGLSRPLSESFAGLTTFFRSVPGRAALSRAGDAKTVEVAEVRQKDDVLYLRVRDAAVASGQPVEPEYWRAILSLNGRIVTLSALGLRDRPLSAAEKRAALEAFVARMRAQNSGETAEGDDAT